MNLQKIQRIIFAVLFVGWMVLIFTMSAQSAEQSSQLSDGLVSEIVEAFYPDFDDLSQTMQTNIIYDVTFMVRKAAHFFEYFVLGLLGILLANTLNKYSYFMRAVLAAVFCVFYAASDEIHQYFVPGRACRFIDILIDSAGILIAIIIISFIIIRKRSGERNA